MLFYGKLIKEKINQAQELKLNTMGIVDIIMSFFALSVLGVLVLSEFID